MTSAVWKENNSSTGIGVVYGIRTGYAFLKCTFGSAFLPGSAIHESINGLADLTMILRDGDEIAFTAVPQNGRGDCKMKVLAADLPNMIVDGLASYADFDTNKEDGGKLAIGMITDIYQHHGYIWSKPFGAVFFSLAHVNTSMKDLTLWAKSGDRVVFKAYPQEMKNNCKTRAVRVEKLKNCKFKFNFNNSSVGHSKSPITIESNRIKLSPKIGDQNRISKSNSPRFLKKMVEENGFSIKHTTSPRLQNPLTRNLMTWDKPNVENEDLQSQNSLANNSNSNSILPGLNSPENRYDQFAIQTHRPIQAVDGHCSNCRLSAQAQLNEDLDYSLWGGHEVLINFAGVIGDRLNSPMSGSQALSENIPNCDGLIKVSSSGKDFEKGLIGVLAKALIFDADIRQLFCQRYPEVICCVAISQFQHLTSSIDDYPKILLARLFANKEGRRILSTSHYAMFVCEVFAFYYHGQTTFSGSEREMTKVKLKEKITN